MNIHFIGIGGIGMSALARFYLERGHSVTGSNDEDSAILEALRDEGFGVFVGHSALHVADDTEMVVYTEAIPIDNLELQAARDRKIPIKTYFEALGEISKDFKTIAVAGTHGKTTTTAILTRILLQSHRDPTVLIGTNMKELDGKNFCLGEGEWLLVEACEYRRSFLHLQPKVVVLTNLELDHPDYYQDLDDYLDAFKELVAKLPKDGVLVANGDDENVRKVAEGVSCEVVYFSATEKEVKSFDLQIPGKHNLMNALAAYATGTVVDVEEDIMMEAINTFEGSWRRFEFKGKVNKALVYDDYAHHPTEVQASIQGAREKYPEHRLVVVFEPHQYNRTRHFLEEFAKSFKEADQVIIPSIYQVRDSEEDLEAVSPEKLVNELSKYHENVRFGDGFEKTIEYLKGSVSEGDLVLVMGAGEVWQVAEGLVI
ncbi:UDP-N-acetylmuramate--L-alanine ligase [Candidatus Peregrinibacteria bacterium]|jgi:UDP-N-acetylmuramate--alanine ligase|nr:UDP-N-acetylmuramate--L-alanine ligase [Candidatus Peregrinibacteria bacterium]MBT7484654.1 UDP-N-acetylmuramate--L-alanine ligase [Candidatus Peregrinibacteria bacterium]MBT7702967.1 UDP-N-acetylmuramate--L-alanine ligase [Candidatus Peregrinibacteria bacterium]